MKLVRLLSVFIVLALSLNSCASRKKLQDSGTNTINGILTAANCPLSEDQAKRLKEFKPGGDRGAFRGVYEIFDEKQTKVLKEVFGSSPGRDGGPERPRFLFFAVIFENENCPFTKAQLDKLKALPGGREAYQQMRDFFTEKQSGIVESMFNR